MRLGAPTRPLKSHFHLTHTSVTTKTQVHDRYIRGAIRNAFMTQIKVVYHGFSMLRKKLNQCS
jgi:hypothetical protein